MLLQSCLQFEILFHHLVPRQNVRERILALRQGKQSAADNALPFLTVTVESGKKPASKLHFAEDYQKFFNLS